MYRKVRQQELWQCCPTRLPSKAKVSILVSYGEGMDGLGAGKREAQCWCRVKRGASGGFRPSHSCELKSLSNVTLKIAALSLPPVEEKCTVSLGIVRRWSA